MAGSQNIGEASDNPVAINVTAMVDVIFCLCLFFMCSFHFKQLEGKIETWLPRGAGPGAASAAASTLEPIRIVFSWEPSSQVTIRKVGSRPPATSDDALLQVILSLVADYRAINNTDFSVLLEPASAVPWGDVVHVMDLLKAQKLDRIEFVKPPKQKKKTARNPAASG